jgi:chlorite dismutase
LPPEKPDVRTEIPPITNPTAPLTLEGSSVLHQMTRVRWSAWRSLPQAERLDIAREAGSALAEWEKSGPEQSAVYSLLGHKGDLMFVHFRNSFDGLNAVEWRLASLSLWDYLEPTTSYLSVVELGLYAATVKLYKGLEERGVKPGSAEWNEEIEELLGRQRKSMTPRLWPEIPPFQYVCFYPMDRKRGESKNWYSVPIAERQRMMHEHGLVGRKYAGTVKQIITGSIGYDDWEWGVDLFADNPLVFKQLIYEMRFDKVSAVYALFGSFFIGMRVAAADLPDLLAGRTPSA